MIGQRAQTAPCREGFAWHSLGEYPVRTAARRRCCKDTDFSYKTKRTRLIYTPLLRVKTAPDGGEVASDGGEGCIRWAEGCTRGGTPFHRFSHRCPTCGEFSPPSRPKTRTFAEKSPTFFRKSPTFFGKSPTFFRKSPTFLPHLRSDFPPFTATAQNK